MSSVDGSSVLAAYMAPIALCHLTRDHLTRSLKSRDATVGDRTWNPRFESVTLLKVTGGLMGRIEPISGVGVIILDCRW